MKQRHLPARRKYCVAYLQKFLRYFPYFDTERVAQIVEMERELGARATVIQGLWTGHVYIIYHRGRTPRRSLLARLTAAEEAFMAPEGSGQ